MPPIPAGDSVAVAAPLAPAIIVILCAVAGLGTYLLLPARREAAWRTIGLVIVLVAAALGAALLVRSAAAGQMGAYFWIFSAIALLGALRVVTHPRPVYSALYFIMTVLASAGLFVLLWAEFMAAALVLIYAGAILVTYVFVIMLAASAQRGGLATQALTEYDAVSREPLAACTVGFVLMAVLLMLVFDRAATLPAAAATEPAAWTTDALARYLFSSQMLNLELAGVILTLSMVGAIVIARRQIAAHAAAGAPEMVSETLAPPSDNPHDIPIYGTKNPRQKAYPEA